MRCQECGNRLEPGAQPGLFFCDRCGHREHHDPAASGEWDGVEDGEWVDAFDFEIIECDLTDAEIEEIERELAIA
jgi:hypothetical protein